jgi:IS5 family transposase
VFAEPGNRSVEKRGQVKGLQVNLNIAMMSVLPRVLNLEAASGQPRTEAEKGKARIWAKVEHPFRIIKCPFGFTQDLYRGLAKPQQDCTRCSLSAICGWFVSILSKRWRTGPTKSLPRLSKIDVESIFLLIVTR